MPSIASRPSPRSRPARDGVKPRRRSSRPPRAHRGHPAPRQPHDPGDGRDPGLDRLRPGEVWRHDRRSDRPDRTSPGFTPPVKHKTASRGRTATSPSDRGPGSPEAVAEGRSGCRAVLAAGNVRAALRGRPGGKTPLHRHAARRRRKRTEPKPGTAVSLQQEHLRPGHRARRASGPGSRSSQPNQIRHPYATRIRREYGLEAAQVLLGHSKADVTQLYAERTCLARDSRKDRLIPTTPRARPGFFLDSAKNHRGSPGSMDPNVLLLGCPRTNQTGKYSPRSTKDSPPQPEMASMQCGVASSRSSKPLSSSRLREATFPCIRRPSLGGSRSEPRPPMARVSGWRRPGSHPAGRRPRMPSRRSCRH